MIEVPNMVMIGATGRNVGKTTLACTLIRHLRRRFRVVAVKVTAVDSRDGPCPRGGEGCGTCAALQGNYEIVEESCHQGDKDTQLMVRAQADHVYWVKVLRSHLQEAVRALLARVDPACIIVCESTSLRLQVEPGLFLLADRDSVSEPRPSARRVRHLADRVLRFDGRGFDARVDHITYDGAKWLCPAAAACVILAGGASRRMGRDKSMLPVQGISLIRYVLQQVTPHFDEVIISSNTPQVHRFSGVKVVSDMERGRGPLMGIFTALQASGYARNFVVACDMPVIDVALIRHLLRLAADYDAVIPRSGPSLFEPLFAVYNRSLLGDIQKTLALGRNRILDALEGSNVLYLDLSTVQFQALRNLNSPHDYQGFLEEIQAEGRQAKDRHLGA